MTLKLWVKNTTKNIIKEIMANEPIQIVYCEVKPIECSCVRSGVCPHTKQDKVDKTKKKE